jgi:hypothetical protein
MMATLTEFNPGNVWPISKAARNSFGIRPLFSVTESITQTQAKSPPPKLVTPIFAKAAKISAVPGSSTRFG